MRAATGTGLTFDEQELRAAVAGILGMAPADLLPETPLASLGTWSLDAQLSLMMSLGDFAGREITPAEIKQLATYGDVVDFLSRGKQGGDSQGESALRIRVEGVFRDVFEEPDMLLTSETSREQLPEWDSVAQVKLILALEETFGVEFSTEEVAAIHTVGGFVEALGSRPL
jgi:acyl carrier protein